MYFIIRAIAEIMVSIVPPLFMKINEICCEKKSEEESFYIGDYIDITWKESDIPLFAIAKMESVLSDENIIPYSYVRCANTCKKLLNNFSMKPERLNEIETIKIAIARYDKRLANEINLTLFSTCALWEGRIALYR